MSNSGFATGWLAAAAVAGIAVAAVQAQTQDIAPVNSGTNPMVSSATGRSSPEKRPWGGSNGVAIDRDGKTVWATDRCRRACRAVSAPANPVHHFDELGKEIKSFGGGMFVWPHGIHVDREGNVWVTERARRQRTRSRSIRARTRRAAW